MPQGTPEHIPDDGLTTRQRRNRPLVIVHTGPGKGKSTAAFGLALRAWNQGWPVGVFQFVKSAKWRVGEERALRLLGETGQGGPVSWNKMGEGWSWIQRDAGGHAEQAAEGWAQIKRDLAAQATVVLPHPDAGAAMTRRGTATIRCPSGLSARRPSGA